MPWKDTCALNERMRFVMEYDLGKSGDSIQFTNHATRLSQGCHDSLESC